MTDTAKPDLSREAVERMIAEIPGTKAVREIYALQDKIAATLRALLDAKEAADRRAVAREGECQAKAQIIADLERKLTEARAANAAAWEAAVRLCAMHTDAGIYMGSDGKGNAKTKRMTGAYLRTLSCPDPSTTEALRRVKAEVWEGGFLSGLKFANGDDTPNPYATEARHD